ncbi:MAG TPA: SGNH hydrolase domain-containing protein, partial [Acidimicrobiales bacterium]|nr:SGNH hydrolase domain-containing protein [Acidimicrobiales bacterium]
MPRRAPSLLRVAGAAVVLLGALSVSMALVGQPSSAGAGPLTLPHPAPFAAVRYGERPLKVLLVGDSMAGSLGVGLGEVAPAYNVELANAGHPGCSVSMDGKVELLYNTAPPGAPCALDRPDHLLAVWQAWVDAFRPDVVVYEGRSDLLNQQVRGRWTWIGHHDFNTWFGARLRAAVAVLSSRGAKVVLMTVPVSEERTERPRPQDNPVRVGRDGAILRLVAAADPGE